MTFESIAFAVALGASAGVVVGFLTARWRGRRTPDEKYDRQARFNSRLLGSLSRGIYAVLGVGLVWTLYFMVIGLADKSQTGYAADAATLIVSVVTIFSILIAYYEFMRRGK